MFFLHSLSFLILCATAVFATPFHNSLRRRQYNNGSSGNNGETFFNVGQNYANEWHGFASGTGKIPAGISLYGDIWGGELNSDSQNFLASYSQNQSGYAEVGMSWKDDMTNHGYTQYQGAQLCNDIATGKFDSNIQKLGSTLGAHPNLHFLLRVDYEVSTNLHANTDPSTFNNATCDPTAYPKAFAHVRSLLKPLVPKISFVYHPVRSEATWIYPGDDQVDFIAFSVFNNDVCLPVGSTTNCEGQQIDQGLQSDITWARAKKPLLVAESAVQPPASSSAEGFIDYLTRVKNLVDQNGFSGWTYINSDWTAHGWDAATWGDSRIESRPEVQQWWEENMGRNRKFSFAQ